MTSVELTSLYSRRMGCEIPFCLYRPEGAVKGVVYLLHGKSGYSERIEASSMEKVWRPRLKLEALSSEFHVAIAAPLCGNGWYLGPVGGMLAEELLPRVEALLGFEAGRGRRALLGFSMGGYGALSLLCRHPGLFGAALVKAPSDPVIREPGGEIRDIAHELLGPPESTPMERYLESYTPNLLMNLAGSGASLALSCGEADTLLPHCRALRTKVLELGLKLAYDETPGEHKLSHADLKWLLGCWTPEA